MRITDMITQDEFVGCFINFSPLLLWAGEGERKGIPFLPPPSRDLVP